jgi:hypothetical protein
MIGQNYCSYCRKPGHFKKDGFKLKWKLSQNNNDHASNNNGNRDNQVIDSQDVAFTVIAESQKLTNNVWICDSGACCHY